MTHPPKGSCRISLCPHPVTGNMTASAHFGPCDLSRSLYQLPGGAWSALVAQAGPWVVHWEQIQGRIHIRVFSILCPCLAFGSTGVAAPFSYLAFEITH